MLTGDSPLTALQIVRTCGIIGTSLPGLLPTMQKSGAVEWVVATGGKHGQTRPLSESSLQLASKFALVVTGDALDAAVDADLALWSVVGEIRVFARMTPQGKATVIRRQMQKQGCHVLRGGDGGNYVGALKQADVGVAMLAADGAPMVRPGDASVAAPLSPPRRPL